MALTGEGLVDEVRSLVGREGATGGAVITDERVTRWLNEGQFDIAEEVLGLNDLQFDSTTLALVTDTVSYAITDITYGEFTDEGVIDIFSIYHLDGANSTELTYKPIDEFDDLLIDPTSSDYSGDRPTRWTRRGDNVEVAPRPSSDYNGDALRTIGQRYPREFTTNDASYTELPNADDGLIYYATWKAWGAIGGPQGVAESRRYKKLYTNPNPIPTEDYGWLQDYKDKHSRMEAWNSNLYD